MSESQLRANSNCPLDSSKLLFGFSGQGSELIGSWHELYNTNSSFKRSLDLICLTAKSNHNLPLASALGLEPNDAKLSVMDTKFLQPAIFAIQVSLLDAWDACGIIPDGVVGHSFGEYAAAVAVGAFTWRQGLAMVSERASMMASLPQNGAMLVVFQSDEDAKRVIAQKKLDLSIACINAPTVTVLCGLAAEISRAESVYSELGVSARRLKSSLAFHSKHMLPMLAGFGAAVSQILAHGDADDSLLPGGRRAAAAPPPTYFSAVSGQPTPAARLREPAYWTAHTEQPVRFLAALQAVGQDGG